VKIPRPTYEKLKQWTYCPVDKSCIQVDRRG